MCPQQAKPGVHVRARTHAIASLMAHLLSFKKTIARFGVGTGGAGADAAGESLFTAHTISKQAQGARCLACLGSAQQRRRASHVVGTGLCVPLLAAELKRGVREQRGGGGKNKKDSKKQRRPVRQ